MVAVELERRGFVRGSAAWDVAYGSERYRAMVAERWR